MMRTWMHSPRLLPIGLLSLLAIATLPAGSARAASNPNARVLLHLTAPVGKAPCIPPGGPPTCSAIRTAGDLAPEGYWALVMVTNGRTSNGVGGVEFGIAYDDDPGVGVDVFSWNACGANIADLRWPASGTGNRVTWSNCQLTEPDGPGTGVSAIACYFYLSAYTSDALAIIPHPNLGDVRVLDCGGTPSVVFDTVPTRWGSAAFSPGAATPGVNPCLIGGNDSECLIQGPSELSPGLNHVYSIESPVPGAIYDWSATAPLMIVGSTTGTSVTVRANVAGVGTLSVSGASPAGGIDCTLLVRVGGGCTINGPDEMAAEDVTVFTSTNGGLWSVQGNAVLVGVADGAIVRSGKGGSFTVTLSAAPTGPTCFREVSILPAENPGSLTGAALVLDLKKVPSPPPIPCSLGAPPYETPPCASASSNGNVYPPDSWYAHVLAVSDDPAASIAGVRFGIIYDDTPGSGVDVYSWHSCGVATHFQSSIGNFPESSGSGLELRWTRPANCQTGTPGSGPETVVLVGFFYVSAYSPGTLGLAPHPVDNRATLYDCDLNPTRMLITDVPSPFGVARFSASGTEPGYNPCGSAVNVQPSTWSRIKTLGR